MEEDKELVVFVVLNYNTWQETVKCVDSILETYRALKKIAVVDNASSNDSFACLEKAFSKEKYADVELLQTEYNGGFSYGNNFAYRYMRKKYQFNYVIFSNNDILFLPGAIEGMISSLKNHDDFLQVAPKVKNLENQAITLPLRRNRSLFESLCGNYSDLVLPEEELVKRRQVYLVSGCCFAVNRRLFEDIGLFDENVFLYNEENILSKKADKKNYSVWFAPDLEVIHNQGASTGTRNIFVDKEFLKSTLYYWRVYEKKSLPVVFLIWLFYNIKIVIKILFRRYGDSHGLINCVKETFYQISLNERIKKEYNYWEEW